MINWRPFWKCSNPGHVMWYVIRVSSERVTIIPETTSPSLSSCCRNLRAEKKGFVPFCYQPPLREYEIRNGISFLPKGGIIETRQIDRLSELRVNYTPCRTANKKIFPLSQYRTQYLKKYFLVQAEKDLTKVFRRCISLWPQAHRFRSERDLGAKRCRIFLEVFIWFLERNSSSRLWQLTRFIFFDVFLF